MSQYTCRLYRNSGFNAVNIPDSPALLDTIGNYVDCYAIELNQERFLPSVRIRGDWLSCRDADYCKVGDFFYFVNSVTMLSGDVAELSLTPDFITSAGGPAALEILDGVTDRVHVTDDTFGIYGADDPFMAPAYDLDIVSYTKDFYENGADYYTFVETTLDLHDMGQKSANDLVEALTCEDSGYTDPDGNHPFVAVPVVSELVGSTAYTIKLPSQTTKSLTKVEGQGVYVLDDSSSSDTIKKGIALARALGIEESISAQYSIPKDFVSPAQGAGAFQLSVQGKTIVTSVPLNYIYGTAVNNRVFYGSYTPYCLAAGSGSSMQALAEEIYNGSAAPTVACFADPRRLGKPYYRFATLNGVGIGQNVLDFFRGSVAGAEWGNIPMVLNGASGSILNQVKYNNASRLTAMQHEHAYDDNQWNYMGLALNAGTSGAGQFANGIGSIFSGDVSGAAGSAINMLGIAGSTALSALNQDRKYNQYLDQYHYQRSMDMQQLKIANSVYVPQLNFPVDPKLFSEVTGNGFSVSRVVYKQDDISRIDKILTAYGYKYSKVLEASDFANRQYFNYVSGSISVGNLPGWWANGIASQIGVGVRVWHVKPNHLYYASNPVVTPTV